MSMLLLGFASLFGIFHNWLKVVYTFIFFEPQNIEQGISNVEVTPLRNSAVPCSAVRYSK
jgi:hypothetical protein